MYMVSHAQASVAKVAQHQAQQCEPLRVRVASCDPRLAQNQAQQCEPLRVESCVATIARALKVAAQLSRALKVAAQLSREAQQCEPLRVESCGATIARALKVAAQLSRALKVAAQLSRALKVAAQLSRALKVAEQKTVTRVVGIKELRFLGSRESATSAMADDNELTLFEVNCFWDSAWNMRDMWDKAKGAPSMRIEEYIAEVTVCAQDANTLRDHIRGIASGSPAYPADKEQKLRDMAQVVVLSSRIFLRQECEMPEAMIHLVLQFAVKVFKAFTLVVPHRLLTEVPWGFLLSSGTRWQGREASSSMLAQRAQLLLVHSQATWVNVLGQMYDRGHTEVCYAEQVQEVRLKEKYSRDVDESVLQMLDLNPMLLAYLRRENMLADLLHRYWCMPAPRIWRQDGRLNVQAGSVNGLSVSNVINHYKLSVDLDANRYTDNPALLAHPDSGIFSLTMAEGPDGSWSAMNFQMRTFQYVLAAARTFHLLSDDSGDDTRTELENSIAVPTQHFCDIGSRQTSQCMRI